MRRRLVLNPLGFVDEGEEQAFFRSFCLDQLRLIQAAIFLAGIIIYVFYIFDKIIDPINWEKTQIIRGIFLTPLIWAGGLLLFMPFARKYFEMIVTVIVICVCCGLYWVASILDHGFDYGIAGLIIVYLFVYAFLPLRLPYYLVTYIASQAIGSLTQFYVANSKPGMIFVNLLFGASAIILIMFSAVAREISARKQFSSMRELEESKRRIEQLVEASFSPFEAQRLKARALAAGFGPARIAISYRRSDSDAMAGRIRDRLVNYFGQTSVFMDIDSVPLGTDFRTHIANVLGQTHLLLAVIGPNWHGTGASGHARISDEQDPVRIEIETALRAQIPILPILVSGAFMPQAADLPTTLQDFPFRNAAEISTGRDFNYHVERLVRAIDDVLKDRMSA